MLEPTANNANLLFYTMSVIKLNENAISLLLYFVTERIVERCVFLTILYDCCTKDRSQSMRELCYYLDFRLNRLPQESYYCEVVSIKHLRYSVLASLFKLKK